MRLTLGRLPGAGESTLTMTSELVLAVTWSALSGLSVEALSSPGELLTFRCFFIYN